MFCFVLFCFVFFFNFCTDDHSRVVLSPIKGVAGSDYINATRVDVSDRFLLHRIALCFFSTFPIVLVVSFVSSSTCACTLRDSRNIILANLIPKISFHSVHLTSGESNFIHSVNVCDSKFLLYGVIFFSLLFSVFDGLFVCFF